MSILPPRAPTQGGAIGVGNTGPVAEFNIQVSALLLKDPTCHTIQQTDPEAAKIVFESGVALTMVPLEVTHTALATPAVLDAVRGKEGPSGAASAFRAKMVDLLTFFGSTYKQVFGFDSPPLHDACAVAYVIDPTLFQSEVMRVVRASGVPVFMQCFVQDIETVSELSAGQTVCDVWHQSTKPKNAHVVKVRTECALESITARDRAWTWRGFGG